MPNDTITLRLSGDVSLDDFVHAVSALRSLVKELGKEVAGGIEISWNVEALEAGSAVTTFRGSAKEADRQRQVESVVAAFEQVGSFLERGGEIPYSPGVVAAARGITGVLNGHIDEILFETDVTEAVVTNAVKSPGRPARPDVFAYGAVEGRVQTLSSRTGLKFTLYDAFGRGIPCYLQRGDEEMMRDVWDKWVVVEGRIHRDTAGKPRSIRRVTDVVVREPGDYRKARGVLQAGQNAPSPEEAIRRLRDAR